MDKRMFIVIIVVVHLGFIFLQIHKQSSYIALSFEKQKNERKKEALIEEKNKLTEQLHLMQNHAEIKKFAQQKLGMKKIRLSDVRQLPV